MTMATTNSKKSSMIHIHRAMKLNNIEDSRLERHLMVLNRERLRSSRLVNQNIRLVNFNLEYIQTTSGHSQEGRDSGSTTEEEKGDVGPCFLYGVRVGSRRFGKFRKGGPSELASLSGGESIKSSPVILQTGAKPIHNNLHRSASVLERATPRLVRRRSSLSMSCPGTTRWEGLCAEYSGPPRLVPPAQTSRGRGFSVTGDTLFSSKADKEEDLGEGINRAIKETSQKVSLEQQTDLEKRVREERRKSLMSLDDTNFPSGSTSGILRHGSLAGLLQDGQRSAYSFQHPALVKLREAQTVHRTKLHNKIRHYVEDNY